MPIQFPLPNFSAIDIAAIMPELDRRLTAHRALIDRLADLSDPDFAQVFGPWEQADDELDRYFQPISHLHNVKDSDALRDAYSDAIEALTEHSTWVGQHQGLCRAVNRIRARADFASLGAAERKLVDDALLDFRLSGVDLPDAERERFKAIATELSRLSTEFEQAVLDATESWSIDLDEADSRLAGLPASARALFADAAKAAERPGYRISLKAPSYQAVITFADDRELRRALYTAYQTRASDQGPDAGRFDNSERLHAILRLRQEAASLLGFASSAHESLATKMADSPEQVLDFLRKLTAKARPQAERELAELAAFAQAQLGLAALEPWDVAYASEKLKQARHQLSEEDLKPYFPVDPVLQGLFGLTEQLFAIRIRERTDVDVWHPDVRYFEVVDAAGLAFAGFYVDLFARTGKRGGAWMDVCVKHTRDGQSRQAPIAFLTCNFAPASAELPSLLTHDDVVTLFHEFGHGLHHLLTEVDYPSLSGIEGVEWDAVELPSQFLENFAWDKRVLQSIGRHWQHGEMLPDELFERLTATRHFQAALFLVRQLEFALFDFRLHLEYDSRRAFDIQALVQSVRSEVAVIQPPAWQRFAHAFTHIFGGGYAAGYYSYLWAEVLSADSFEIFNEAGTIAPALGQRFRREILAVGGSRPAAESVRAFLGRDPDPDALIRSYGLAA